MREAMREACKRVFSVHGCAASIASSRLTDVSSRLLSSTSQRTRERSATCRGPIRGGSLVRKQPYPVGLWTPTRRRSRAWRPRPTGPSASMVRPSRTRMSSARRASKSLPGKHSWVICPRARESTLGFQGSCRRITHRTLWAAPACSRARLA
jgi:hypothetical protein